MNRKTPKKHPVGSRIREIRGAETLEAFAARLGIKNPTVYRYETDRIPDADMLLKIAALDPLRRGVEWLLTGQAPPYYKGGVGGEGRVGELEEEYYKDKKRMRLVHEVKELVRNPETPDGVIDALLKNVEWFKKVPKE